MEEPIFARIASQSQEESLQERSATPAEFHPPTKAELEELRRLVRPPRPVQECLELLYAVLHVKATSKSLQRVPPGGRVAIAWASVQMMLARFERFFPAMAEYDIAPLVETPELLRYLSDTYLSEGKLTEERVRRCSTACASLFHWCSRSVARVEAALELLAMGLDPSAASPQAGRWRCCVDDGWRDYPAEVDALLTEAEAEASGEVVCFDLGGERYEVDLAARVQRNVWSGMRRPIRPPGDEVSLRSIQGYWRINDGPLADSVARVQGTSVTLNGQLAEPELEVVDAENGRRRILRWDFEGAWLAIRGSPLAVIWSHGGGLVGWDAVAGEPEE